jgi:hypothetical protein
MFWIGVAAKTLFVIVSPMMISNIGFTNYMLLVIALLLWSRR